MNFSVESQIPEIDALLQRLKNCDTWELKLNILNELSLVQASIAAYPLLASYLKHANPAVDFALKAVLALHQGPLVFKGLQQIQHPTAALDTLAQTLLEVEQVYAPLGGVLGYHLTVLKLMQIPQMENPAENVRYLHPLGHEIGKVNGEVRQSIRWGIETLAQLAEIYPAGGAGDRLNLVDEEGHPLPAAELQFEGRSLLEGLIRDLQGREYLHFKLVGTHLITPLAIMTSHEKDNHAHILSICENSNWFGRPRNTFFFFNQPLVPVITKTGDWSLSEPLQLHLKPGGHGLLWKLALESGALEYLLKTGRSKVLVRQINNPMAGIDYGLLAFTGLGIKRNKKFGFASCERLLKMAEGMDVLIEQRTSSGYEYLLTNVEYTDFAQKGLQDRPCKEGEPYSIYPSNTNILFADLEAISGAIAHNPFPGMLLNMKTKMESYTRDGQVAFVDSGRLETTMQNIADSWPVQYAQKPSPDELADLPTYITFNQRRKTISVTKSSFQPGKSSVGTPEGCYYDLMLNRAELLRDVCKMKIPEVGTEEDYLKQGPGFIFGYHPALGPLYEVIAQKVRGGILHAGAELNLEITEVDIENLELQGSLLIEGDINLSRCILKSVQVVNRGIDRAAPNIYWKREVARLESLGITLEGHAEFYAENVVFQGDLQITILDGERLVATMRDGELHFERTPLKKLAPLWKYVFDTENRIILSKQP